MFANQFVSWKHQGMPGAILAILILSGWPAVSNARDDSGPPITQERPNVLLFFVDDLGYYDLGCYGSTGYQTPRLDQLAKRSVRFTNFYSANPVCSPTRAALMTGKAPQRVGITQWINQPNELHLPLAEFTLGEAMSSAGYRTGYIGKWHLGEKDDQQPDHQGFDWMQCVNRAGQPGSYFFPFRRPGKNQDGNAMRYWDVPDLESSRPGDYLTNALTDKAIEFIDQDRSKPFFLCFAHYAVHTPIQSPPELVQEYKERFANLPTLESDTVPERNQSRSRARQDNPAYAAMVENLDSNVGRVLDHLDSKGLLKSTLIIFTSDNGGLSTTGQGGPTSCRPLRAGKGWTYEGGIKIPTLIAWPEKIQPCECATLGITMDLYPTILELTGLPLRQEQHLDGVSLVSALHGSPNDALTERFLAWTYPHRHGSGHTPSNAIRLGDWKLIERIDDLATGANRWELYSLADDPGEAANIADSNPQQVEILVARLHRWLEATRPDK